jgi:L-ascorbate metabolism protein UlaG (beta-lactamase superfamily)
MDLTWLGTAGFIAKTKGIEIAFDPFLSRGAGIPSPFTANSFQNVEAIFVGHGHFDHSFDIPAIASKSDLKVYAPGLTGQVLKLRGLSDKQLRTASNKEALFKNLNVQAFKSAHVMFDLPLVISTAKRCGVAGCMHVAWLGLAYPQGLVQSYLFQAEGRKVLFLSSAGCTKAELQIYKNLEVDILLAPLQGHSHIQDIAAEHAAIINPKIVIPHHHDDFYPPMSQEISIEMFKESLKKQNFKGQMIEIPLFQSIHI